MSTILSIPIHFLTKIYLFRNEIILNIRSAFKRKWEERKRPASQTGSSITTMILYYQINQYPVPVKRELLGKPGQAELSCQQKHRRQCTIRDWRVHQIERYEKFGQVPDRWTKQWLLPFQRREAYISQITIVEYRSSVHVVISW